MDLSADTLRKRFAKLTRDHDTIRGKSTPLRESYDALVQANRRKEDKAAAEIKKTEDGLYDIEQERAVIARALGGKTSEPAEG